MQTHRAYGDGMPIEQAPLWVLAIVVFLLWLVAFPALVGLWHGFGLWHGERLGPAIAGAVLALVLALGLWTRAPWQRTEGLEQRPLFARFSAWLIGLVLYPNLMMGIVLLTRPGPPPDYWTTGMIGLVLSATQGILALAQRRGERKRAELETAASDRPQAPPEQAPRRRRRP